MKKSKKYSHSTKFYQKQYIKYKQETTDLFGNYKDFEAAYKAAEMEGRKDITKNLVYSSKYGISYDTYKAEKAGLKEAGVKFKAKDLKTLSTTEFAKKYNTEIMQLYNDLRQSGNTGSDVGWFISSYFFGSL